ncbi:hypothetical protein K7X08_014959 [Anisodus acutangulus]|uniref:Uncharacterized protein n=1 Tax=Anisodus acutangulus TaxID=402998 RepID=A0A9Q1R1Q7_9SOLA|nr:hypothetical protein K7X08_014959 [Anisodus acutangulus]
MVNKEVRNHNENRTKEDKLSSNNKFNVFSSIYEDEGTCNVNNKLEDEMTNNEESIKDYLSDHQSDSQTSSEEEAKGDESVTMPEHNVADYEENTTIEGS